MKRTTLIIALISIVLAGPVMAAFDWQNYKLDSERLSTQTNEYYLNRNLRIDIITPGKIHDGPTDKLFYPDGDDYTGDLNYDNTSESDDGTSSDSKSKSVVPEPTTMLLLGGGLIGLGIWRKKNK